jgi:hypothetical protein
MEMFKERPERKEKRFVVLVRDDSGETVSKTIYVDEGSKEDVLEEIMSLLFNEKEEDANGEDENKD